MKTNKTKRLIAFVLTLVMIVPLIGVPVFAADAGSVYTVYTNDFEGKTFDTDLDGDGTNDAYKMVAGEDSLQDFGEDYIVKDPTGADDDVWSISMAATTGTQVTGIRPTYVDYGTVFFENDVYIPSGATGWTRWRMYGTGTYGDAATDHRWWFTFYDLNLNGAKIVMPDATEVALKKDTWFTISYALEMTTGAVTLYVNGDQAYTGFLLGSSTSEGYKLTNVRMELFYNAMVDVAGLKSLYVDNINVFEGTAPSNHMKHTPLFNADFEGKTYDTDLDGDGTNDAYKIVDSESGFFYDADEGLNLDYEKNGISDYHYVMADPADAGNHAWRIPMAHAGGDHWGRTLPVMTNAAYEHNELVMEMDLYIPNDATGWARWRSYGGRNPNGDLGGYHVFMDLDLGSGTIWAGDHSYSVSKDTWFKVSLCMNFQSGAVNIYVDNTLAVTADLGDNLIIGYFWFAMVDVASAPGKYLWADNLSIFTGNEPSNHVVNNPPAPPVAISPIYSNNMEGWEYDTDLNDDTVNDAHKLTNAENIGYNNDRPNAVIDAWYAENGGQATANDYHYFVQDPTGAANDVWRIPMSIPNNDSWGHLIAGRDPFSYANVQKILLENDIYISEGAVGKVNWQIYAGAFKSLFNLSLHDAAISIDTDHNKNVSIVGNTKLKQEQWYKLSYALDLVSGDWSLYVDQALVATGNINLTNIAVIWLWNARLLGANADYTGYLYVDNINVYAANDLSTIYTEKSASVEDGKTLQYVDVTLNGETVKTVSTKYLVAANDDTFSATPVYFDDSAYNGIVSMPAEKGTSVRYGEPTGLRFKTNVNADLVKALQEMVTNGTLVAVEMGTLIAPEDYLAGGKTLKDLTAYTSDEYKALENKPADGYALKVAATKYYEENTIVGSIVNIQNGNYDRSFAAAGYVKVTLLTGEVITYVAAEPTVANVKEVAQNVLNAAAAGEFTVTEYQKNILDGFVAAEA